MHPFTENHLVEQPAVQLMQHELGWEVVNCYDEPSTLKLRRSGWSGGGSNQGRDGKREVVLVSRLRPALQRLNPDLPGVEMGILNDGFWILNGRGRRQAVLRLNSALSLAAGLICWPVKFLDTLREPAP